MIVQYSREYCDYLYLECSACSSDILYFHMLIETYESRTSKLRKEPESVANGNALSWPIIDGRIRSGQGRSGGLEKGRT